MGTSLFYPESLGWLSTLKIATVDHLKIYDSIIRAAWGRLWLFFLNCSCRCRIPRHSTYKMRLSSSPFSFNTSNCLHSLSLCGLGLLLLGWLIETLQHDLGCWGYNYFPIFYLLVKCWSFGWRFCAILLFLCDISFPSLTRMFYRWFFFFSKCELQALRWLDWHPPFKSWYSRFVDIIVFLILVNFIHRAIISYGMMVGWSAFNIVLIISRDSSFATLRCRRGNKLWSAARSCHILLISRLFLSLLISCSNDSKFFFFRGIINGGCLLLLALNVLGLL